MNIEAIYQNADVVSQSVSGEINRVQIGRDEYDFLTEYTDNVNKYIGYGDDVVELDYHNEFLPLIEQARERLTEDSEAEEAIVQAVKENLFEGV